MFLLGISISQAPVIRIGKKRAYNVIKNRQKVVWKKKRKVKLVKKVGKKVWSLKKVFADFFFLPIRYWLKFRLEKCDEI